MLDSRYINLSELLQQMRGFLRSNGVPKNEILKLSEASLPARKLVVPTTPDIKLKEGKKISIDPFEFKVLSTPGHSPGHICLYEPHRKLLLAVTTSYLKFLHTSVATPNLVKILWAPILIH